MKLELIYQEAEQFETYTSEYKEYRIGHYTLFVEEAIGKQDGKRITTMFSIEADNDDYLPQLYYRKEEKVVLVQTTAYGAKKPDEIRKIIQGYEEAVQVAETITKEFF